MKKTNLFASLAAAFLASLTTVQAQSVLTAWNFDNVGIGASSGPMPSTGPGTASAYNMANTPNVVSLSGSSAGGANSWQLSGWSTGVAVGQQGAKFALSSIGYYQLQVSFDVYADTNAETALQVQFTTDGSFWQNAAITSAGSSAVLRNNTNPTNDLVVGSYITLTNNGTATWDNNVQVNLTGIAGVDNDPNFAIRIVNASTATNCLDTRGNPYNNATGGNWTFDNVAVSGVSFDTVASWTFENIVAAKHINNPVPSISNNTATAQCYGFGTPANPLTSSTFSSNPSTNDADVTANGAPFSSTGSAGQNVWRLRGQPGNGWLSTQGIGSQGAEFDVSTVNYTNILVTFDLYFTSQGEAKMCVLYTTDGWATTNVANNFACSTYPTLMVTNTPGYTSPTLNGGVYSANTVNGTLFFNTVGSLFYNYMSVDFTGVPGVAFNPNFAFRVVNAATGLDCVNALNQAYNNNSGNARIDNVSISGQFTGTVAPTLTNAPVATVDAPFTNTFTDTTGWYTNISSIYVNGVKLTNSAYTVTSSNIVYTPSATAPVLTVSGFDYIVIYATNYTSAKVTQFVGTGVATKLAFTQPTGPSASGGTLIINPSFTVTDQYGNGTTNPYVNMVVTASVSNSPATWVLGGSTNQAILNGSCTFTDLTATVTGTTAITNAAIHFTITGGPISVTNSVAFTIGAPAVPFTQGNLAAVQIDTTGNNTTFSIVELKPSAAGQTVPVNINPITATGTNALRLSGSGSCGHLSLSDDGSFLVFAAFDDNSSATPDETFNLNRAVGTLNFTNLYAKVGRYLSTSYGGSQARSACSPDNADLLIDDKGGLYVWNHINNVSQDAYEQNNYCTRSFGGEAWVMTQKIVGGLPAPSVFAFDNGTQGQLDYGDIGNDSVYVTGTATPPPDGNGVDFYMLSTNGSANPASFNILYTLDQNSGTNGSSGVITKYSTVDQLTWTFIGSWTNTDNGASLFATTNGNGGVYLYYANGGGGSAKNSLIRVTDQSLMGNLNIISTNTIYTAPAGASVEGVTFVPVPTNSAASVPPPVLTAQTTAYLAGTTFTITNTPDDPYWRSNITTIAVNGTVLTGGYNTNMVGAIVFTNAMTAGLVQGSNNIVISAAGYSTNSVVQYLIGADNQLVIKTEPSGTNAAGATFSTPPAVYIEDSSGDVDVANSSTVVAVIVGTGTGPLTGTTTATASKGVVTFSSLKAPTLVQTGLKLTFTNSVLPNLLDNTSIKIIAAAPSLLAMKTEPSSTVTVGSAFTQPPAVYIEDTYGNVVTTANSNVVAQVGTGSGTLTGTTTVAASSGVATFTSALLAPTVAQTGLKLTFTSATLTSVADLTSIRVTAGNPNKLGITTQPTAPIGNGGALAIQPVVVVQDQYGNIVTTATSNIVAQVGAGTWTLGGATTKGAVSGSSAFTGLTATSAGSVTGATITFTLSTLTSVTSSGFNIPAPIKSKAFGVQLVGGNLVFSFTNVTGLSFSILSTNDITVPQTNWPVVGAAVESPAGSGNYQYTNSSPATNAQQFYIIRQP